MIGAEQALIPARHAPTELRNALVAVEITPQAIEGIIIVKAKVIHGWARKHILFHHPLRVQILFVGSQVFPKI